MRGTDFIFPDGFNAQIYEQLYKNSPVMHRTINTDGVIILCNNAYAEKLGYSIEDVLGSTIFDHVAEKSKDNMNTTYQKWKQGEAVSNLELWFKRKDGAEFPVFLNANNLYDKNNKVIGSNTVIRDITEIYNAQVEIANLKTKRLAVIGELSARIAHDLKSPLSVIRSTIQIMDEINDPSLEKYAKYFQKINNAIMRISHQVDEVMDYVKPKPLKIQSHSLLQIINHVVEGIQSQQVIINLPNNNIIIDCDDEKLEIVFANLILNAMQAMSYDGTINIRIRSDEDTSSIDIEDSGPGIPDELKEKIFEPLFTTREIGTGLGLPSCRAIVEKHGGTISVKSNIGEGTVFTIMLPKLKIID